MEQSLQGGFYSKTVFFYMAREILFTFCVCFLFFFFIFFVNQLLLMAGEILEKRVPVHQVALLILYSLPSIIAMASPFACLTGTLMTIGRLSSDNEILVLLSSGFSYRSIFFPAIAVGTLISLFSFLANDILLPAGTIQFSRLYRRILISSPALELEANSVKRFKNSVVITGPVSDKTIEDILIIDRTAEGERRLIIAKRAALEDMEDGRLSINLEKAFLQSGKENLKQDYDYASALSLKYLVPRDDLVQAVYAAGPREMSSVDVKKEIQEKRITLSQTMEAEYRKITGETLKVEQDLREGNNESSRPGNTVDDLAYMIDAARDMLRDRSLSIYRLEYYKKFSIPFGALSFVLAAVSIGLMARKSGQTVGFIVGICIAALYWSLLLTGQDLGMRGFSPFWAMWFPNILAIAGGLILTVVRVFV
ncbi:MAG: LptF/LptG family permease [Spirochaetaceae bacterium]|jgi:lipopolysaccharide export system permease protein|nr:LptF/LptG family permease [Spirochaetaceae bacterium]